MSDTEKRADLVKLYDVHSRSLNKYTDIIWQFPTALIGVNAFALDKFRQLPVALLATSLLNFVLIYALWRHVQIYTELRDATRAVEKELKEQFAPAALPDFTRGFRPKPSQALVWALGWQTLRTFCTPLVRSAERPAN
jgi:hypothetical protein